MLGDVVPTSRIKRIVVNVNDVKRWNNERKQENLHIVSYLYTHKLPLYLVLHNFCFAVYMNELVHTLNVEKDKLFCVIAE